MSKHLQQLRSGKEFIHYAQARGAEVRNGKGSHAVVSTAKGQIVVPAHNRDLGTGLRLKLVKTFVAIGLAVLALHALLGI